MLSLFMRHWRLRLPLPRRVVAATVVSRRQAWFASGIIGNIGVGAQTSGVVYQATDAWRLHTAALRRGAHHAPLPRWFIGARTQRAAFGALCHAWHAIIVAGARVTSRFAGSAAAAQARFRHQNAVGRRGSAVMVAPLRRYRANMATYRRFIVCALCAIVWKSRASAVDSG
jgi:hypothetical protein